MTDNMRYFTGCIYVALTFGLVRLRGSAINESCEDDYCRDLRPDECYYNRQTCCQTCAKFNTGLTECEFGDRATICDIRLCENRRNWHVCCLTCRAQILRSSTSALTTNVTSLFTTNAVIPHTATQNETGSVRGTTTHEQITGNDVTSPFTASTDNSLTMLNTTHGLLTHTYTSNTKFNTTSHTFDNISTTSGPITSSLPPRDTNGIITSPARRFTTRNDMDLTSRSVAPKATMTSLNDNNKDSTTYRTDTENAQLTTLYERIGSGTPQVNGHMTSQTPPPGGYVSSAAGFGREAFTRWIQRNSLLYTFAVLIIIEQITSLSL